MSEIFRDTVGKAAVLNVPDANVYSVKFFKNGKQIGNEITGVTKDPLDKMSRVPIPYAVTHTDGDFIVSWKFFFESETYERKDQHTVITPLFSIDQLRSFNPAFQDYDTTKYLHLEGAIRGVIEAITGQSFGYEKGICEIYGNGGSALSSNKRVISVDKIVTGANWTVPMTYRPIANGFGIERVTQNWAGWSSFESKSPITSPEFYDRRTAEFRDNAKYIVHGEFGWMAVPEDINRAALLMAEVYACSEATYRDRYLRAVSAADWRFDFNDLAFVGTGSVTADTLLSPYIVSRWAVV